jgi:hypothetical protein
MSAIVVVDVFAVRSREHFFLTRGRLKAGEDSRMRRNTLAALALGIGVLIGATPIVAHHSFSAEFDSAKQVEKRGFVTKVDWTNPHVWFYINVKDEKTGKISNWGFRNGPAARPSGPRLDARPDEDWRRGHRDRQRGEEWQYSRQREKCNPREDGQDVRRSFERRATTVGEPSKRLRRRTNTTRPRLHSCPN